MKALAEVLLFRWRMCLVSLIDYDLLDYVNRLCLIEMDFEMKLSGFERGGLSSGGGVPGGAAATLTLPAELRRKLKLNAPASNKTDRTMMETLMGYVSPPGLQPKP